jgi:hypothetical protein
MENWLRRDCFNFAPSSDAEAEAEAPEAVDLWWKRKRLKYAASASGLFQS